MSYSRSLLDGWIWSLNFNIHIPLGRVIKNWLTCLSVLIGTPELRLPDVGEFRLNFQRLIREFSHSPWIRELCGVLPLGNGVVESLLFEIYILIDKLSVLELSTPLVSREISLGKLLTCKPLYESEHVVTAVVAWEVLTLLIVLEEWRRRDLVLLVIVNIPDCTSSTTDYALLWRITYTWSEVILWCWKSTWHVEHLLLQL